MKKIKLLTPIITTSALAGVVLPLVTSCGQNTSGECKINFDESNGVSIDKETYKLNEKFEALLTTESVDLIVDTNIEINIDGRRLGTHEYTATYVKEQVEGVEKIVALKLEIESKFMTGRDLSIVAKAIVGDLILEIADQAVTYAGETRRVASANTWEQTAIINGFKWKNITPATDKSKISAKVEADGVEGITSRIVFVDDNTFNVEAVKREGYFYSDAATCKIQISFYYNGKLVDEFKNITYNVQFETKWSDLQNPSVNFSFNDEGAFTGIGGELYIINPSIDATTNLVLAPFGEQEGIPEDVYKSISVNKYVFTGEQEEWNHFLLKPVFTIDSSSLNQIELKTYHIKLIASSDDLADKGITCSLNLAPGVQSLESGTQDNPLQMTLSNNTLSYSESNPLYFYGFKEFEITSSSIISASYYNQEQQWTDETNNWTVNLAASGPCGYDVSYTRDGAGPSTSRIYRIKFAVNYSYTGGTGSFETEDLYIEA